MQILSISAFDKSPIRYLLSTPHANQKIKEYQ